MDIISPLVLAILFAVLSLILCVVSIIALGRHNKASQALIESLGRAEQARNTLIEKLERDEQSRQTFITKLDMHLNQMKDKEEADNINQIN